MAVSPTWKAHPLCNNGSKIHSSFTAVQSFKRLFTVECKVVKSRVLGNENAVVLFRHDFLISNWNHVPAVAARAARCPATAPWCSRNKSKVFFNTDLIEGSAWWLCWWGGGGKKKKKRKEKKWFPESHTQRQHQSFPKPDVASKLQPDNTSPVCAATKQLFFPLYLPMTDLQTQGCKN